MTEPSYVHLRKTLRGNITSPVWPVGIRLAPFDVGRHIRQAHDLLVEAYRHGGGRVVPFEEWWSGLRQDPEYDPSVFFVALEQNDDIAGLAQCWTSGFLKDLAVADVWRRKGIGQALLLHAFITFQRRGVKQFDLKVEVDNPSGAGRLYGRLGMESVE